MKKLILLIVGIVSIGLLPLLWGNYHPGADFFAQQIPFMLETKRMFSSGAPFWSWNTFIGDNFIGGYAFYTLTSPFVWLVTLFPRNMVLVGILIAFYLKTIAVGCAAYAYIKRMGYSRDLCVIGGLCYVFSTYFVTNLTYYHFCEPMIVFPLLLIAIENVFENQRYAVSYLVLASFAVLWINYYFAISSFLLGLFYAVIRYLFHYKQLKTVKWGGVVFKAFLGIFIGTLLASVTLIPSALHVMGSGRSASRLFVETNIGGILSLVFEDIRELIMPKISECHPAAFTYSYYTSTAAFIPLIGLLPLLCLFKSKAIFAQTKWLVLLILFLIVCYLTPLNNVFNLFTNTGYTRWLYGFTLFIALAFVFYISKNKISKKLYWLYVVLSVGFVLTLLAFLLWTNRGKNFSLNWREQAELSLFVLNVVLLGIYVYTNQSAKRFIQLFSISATINFSCAVFLLFHIGTHNGTIIYFDQLMNGTLSYSDDAFQYRTDFDSDYVNCGLIENRPQVMTYHSISNKYLDDFRMLISNSLSSPTMAITRDRESVDALLSVKEFIDYHYIVEGAVPLDRATIELVKKGEVCDKYKFKYYIPMGFAYDTYITRDEFDSYLSADTITKPVQPLLDNLVIETKDVAALSKYLKHGKISSDVTLDSLVADRNRYTAVSFVGDTRGFKMNTDFDVDRVVFISVTADPGFTATIDGRETEIYNVNLGMSAIVVPRGEHTIDFIYTTPGLRLGAALSAFALLILLLIFRYERKRNGADAEDCLKNRAV